ncbi:MAG: hypothetical protein WA634_05505 [Silvibacterium sp.]
MTIQKSSSMFLRFLLLSSIAAGGPLLTTATAQTGSSDNQGKLIQIVQENTRQYANVNVATADGYAPFLGCVTGPDQGAMGIHYVNGALLNGTLDPKHPQALIYEPSGGELRLVGVEFIVFQAAWDAANKGVPPILEGQSLQFVDAPNRFGIPAFYELHVWAWRNSPLGTYVDWNTNVTCAND